MPTIVSSDLKPTFVAKPDMRFATTFLSNKYRDYAADGESLVDKATGEIFIKRPTDGKVVSFFQNKKYMHDLVLELRVLLTNNESFNYPSDNEEAYYLSTDYDIMTINDERVMNIASTNTEIPNTADTSVHQLKFNLSTGTNGFFCRPTSRDADKVIIEYITNQYNVNVENYAGTNATLVAEKAKFTSLEKWKDSNVILNYVVYITKDSDTRTYDVTDYIRLNEEMCVMLPMSAINADFPDGYDTATVEIQSLNYYKIQFMLQNQAMFDGFPAGITKFMYPDNQILVNYFNVVSFVDSSDDINLLGNESIIGALDIPYVTRYMSKLSKLQGTSEFIVTIDRPTNDDWSANTIWGERVRDAYVNGRLVDRDSETDIRRLERYLAKNVEANTISANVEDEDIDSDAFYAKESKSEYTAAEVNRKLEKLSSYIIEKAESAVHETTASNIDLETEGLEIGDNSLILQIKREEE